MLLAFCDDSGDQSHHVADGITLRRIRTQAIISIPSGAYIRLLCQSSSVSLSLDFWDRLQRLHVFSLFGLCIRISTSKIQQPTP